MHLQCDFRGCAQFMHLSNLLAADAAVGRCAGSCRAAEEAAADAEAVLGERRAEEKTRGADVFLPSGNEKEMFFINYGKSQRVSSFKDRGKTWKNALILFGSFVRCHIYVSIHCGPPTSGYSQVEVHRRGSSARGSSASARGLVGALVV